MALASLPAEQREIVILKLYHGMTFEEIGALVEISPNTAASRYRYGLEKLRKGFSKQEEDLPHVARA